MIGVKIGWLALAMFLFVFVFGLGNTAALIMLILLAGIPICSMLLNGIIKRKLEFGIRASANLKKGKTGTVVIEMANSTWIPVFCVRIRIMAENQLNKEVEKITVMTWIPPKKVKQVEVCAGSKYCGRMRIRLEQIVLYDCFGLIGIPCRYDKAVYVTVQPDTFEMKVSFVPVRNSAEDSDTYSQERPGSDMTETFQIREYVPGDSLRQIHWKLTGKLDKLIVRDPSLPITRNVLVFWERTGESGDLKMIDAQAETIVSLGQALLEQSVPFTIGWNDTDRNLCILQEIQDMDQLIGIIPRLMSASGVKEGISGAGLLLQTRPDALCGHMVYLAQEAQPELMEVKKYGRVSALLGGGMEVEGALIFDRDHYRDQLSHIEM